ncbi:pyruvate kinase [Anaerosacchariphilus polymeriproducens]|uniref:Pyruvate kinase n=1 Tax=Anaerosacchariphilus polymeriproducens TaxID=1812858 RepID=A0A371AT91_9FIRM|nr:pyruvate kinase [Anaerosacchariphilus polymeriproducens]RDU22797.1 pyruvate kinase [Anaerosacchariphilus polymeriproducens]
MKRFILTVGPSLMNTVKLNEIHNEKYIYRINGAHGSVRDIEEYILEIRRQVPGADILMDLPGNKVRTKDIEIPITLEKGKEFEIPCNNFNYQEFYKHLEPGMTAWANDSTFEFEVKKTDPEKITFLSKSEGALISNKGVHIRGIHDDIPFLFEKDRSLIDLANQYHLSFVGLSFVRKPENIIEVKNILDSNVEIISKVETLEAVENLNEILQEVKYILVDRGDLSTDIGIEKIPRYQKFIIQKALYYGVNVFLATQVLKNMEEKPIPTIAEIDDLYQIYTSGVYGVQMSEETAVGKYIKECINILEKMCDEVEKETLVL